MLNVAGRHSPLSGLLLQRLFFFRRLVLLFLQELDWWMPCISTSALKKPSNSYDRHGPTSLRQF